MGNGPHIRVTAVGEDTDYAQKGKKWKLLRRCMMTASNAGKTHNKGHHDTPPNPTKLSESYMKPFDSLDDVSDVVKDNMAYGNHMEKRAVKKYTDVVRHYYMVQYPNHNVEVTTTDVAFYIHAAGLFMASPDSEVDVTVTDRTGKEVLKTQGVLEVKCPVHTYFAKRDPRYIKDPKKPITYGMWEWLIPGPHLESTDRKYGGGSLPAPKMDLSKKQKETDLYRERHTVDRHFGIDGRYSQYFSQCLLNLFLSEREWCDFFVWADDTPDKKGRTHQFWYKPNREGDPFPSIHIERIYRDDPLIKEMYMDLLASIKLWTQSHSQALKANINEFLQEISKGGEEELTLPELDPAEGEEHCPESEFLREEEEEEEEGSPSSVNSSSSS